MEIKNIDGKRFVDIKIDYDIPFGRMETFYSSQGVDDVIENEKARRGYENPQDLLLDPNIVRCSSKTQKKLVKQWEYNWRNYNYDHHTGLQKTKTLKKYKSPHSLSYGDKERISWTFYLGSGPGSDDNLEDDILRICLDWEEKAVKHRSEVE